MGKLLYTEVSVNQNLLRRLSIKNPNAHLTLLLISNVNIVFLPKNCDLAKLGKTYGLSHQPAR